MVILFLRIFVSRNHFGTTNMLCLCEDMKNTGDGDITFQKQFCDSICDTKCFVGSPCHDVCDVNQKSYKSKCHLDCAGAKQGPCSFLSCRCGIEKSSNKPHNRIIGGSPVSIIDKYPWLVSLWGKSVDAGSFCGGTLVASKYVITAAHCVDRKWIWTSRSKWINLDDGIAVLVGEYDHNQIDEKNLVKVKTITIHPTWLKCKRLMSSLQNTATPNTDLCIPFGSDIAIMELTETVDLMTHSPACLPFGDNIDTFDGKMATIAGWGQLEPNLTVISTTNVPYEVDIPVLPAEDCKWINMFPVPEDILCAGFENGGKSGCNVRSL